LSFCRGLVAGGWWPLQLTELEAEFGSLEGVGRARAER
jgi:hypothetical protein